MSGNLSASVLARLLTLAKQRGDTFRSPIHPSRRQPLFRRHPHRP